MGTPEEIKLAERIRLLHVGKEIGQSLDIRKLPAVLEEIKIILLPLVEWLDKPFVPNGKRAMFLLEFDFITIGLKRSGVWSIKTYGLGSGQIYHEVDSQQLAEIMIRKFENLKLKDLLKLYLDDDLLKEISFFRGVALYEAVILRVLSLFFETVEKQLQEREERIRCMRKRLNLLGDFTQSLDPLVSQGKEIPIKEYSIFENHDRGTSRCTGDYLCPEALKPFWGVVKSLRSGGSDKYKEVISEYHLGSLKEILQRVRWIVEEISKTGSKDTKSLFGCTSGRLPLSQEELGVL